MAKPKRKKEDDDMGKAMITSGMTEGQINRACEIFRAQLTKHASEFPSEVVRQVFGQSELGLEWLEVFRKRVEATSNLIVRHVKVDRSSSSQQAIEVTGRVQYTDKSVVATMPRGEGEEVDVFFFNPRPEAYDGNGWLSDEALKREFEFYGLKPDPRAQARVNADDPAFADKHPNGTHWKDGNDRWCFAAFDHGIDGRRLRVGRHRDDWRGAWWFGGEFLGT
ncbi:MAG: hypothetical protein M0Q92_08800 [Methanoregula sp.]|jgi:hypothetical protein|nr:hypothetical protein [Methanoregula sp.]